MKTWHTLYAKRNPYKTVMERKLIELLIEEDGTAFGVEAISLVKFPAIEESFVFFNKNGNTQGISLAAMDEEQRTLVGAALIPEKNIPRYDEQTNEEYDVFFSQETVKLASELFLKTNRTNDHTKEHLEKIEDVSVTESWIVEDPELDKSKMYGFSVPKGTWMVKVHVANDEVWQEVKEGKLRGFSVEGYFADKMVEMSQAAKMKQVFQKLWFAVKRKFYTEITLSNGTVIATESDALEAGSTVFAIDKEGLPTELSNGKYESEGGIELEVYEGVLIEYNGEVKAVEEAAEEVEMHNDVQHLNSMKVMFYKTLLKRRYYNRYE
jgi:hypothetical protein